MDMCKSQLRSKIPTFRSKSLKIKLEAERQNIEIHPNIILRKESLYVYSKMERFPFFH